MMVAAEAAYAVNPDLATRTSWLHCRREYELHLLEHMFFSKVHVTQKSFEHGNKACRLLAYLTRPNRTPISSPRILTSQDMVSDVPQKIRRLPHLS